MEDKSSFEQIEDYKAKRDALQRALKEGEESDIADYSFSGLITELDKENPS